MAIHQADKMHFIDIINQHRKELTYYWSDVNQVAYLLDSSNRLQIRKDSRQQNSA